VSRTQPARPTQWPGGLVHVRVVGAAQRNVEEVAVTGQASEDGGGVAAAPMSRRPARVVAAVSAIAVLGAAAWVVTGAVELGRVDWTSGALLPAYAFAALLIAGELRPLLVAREDGDTDTVTVSTTFAVALVLSGPLVLAMTAQALAVAYDDLVRRRQYLQAAFNIGQYMVTLAAARLVFSLATGTGFFDAIRPLTPADILPGLLAGATFFLVNNGLVAVIVAVTSGRSPWAIVSGDVRAQGLATSILIGLAPVAAIAADFSLLTIPLLVLPLLGVQHSAHLAARRQHEALHDGLTGLPNRTLLRLRAGLALEEATRARTDGSSAVIMVLDLDHFKEVNDTLGHHVGDALLCEVANRVTALCPDDVTVSRLGGDEFAVLVPSTDPDSARRLADRIADDLRRPAVVDGVRIALQSSIGVAVAPEDASTVEGLLQRADIALYRAKASRGTVESYREEFDTHTVQRLNVVADLHTAVADDQMSLAFQPIVDTRTRRIVALEALLRWTHPAHGSISPAEFIPLAERSGAISSMSQYALDGALAATRRLRDRRHDISVSVNLSPRLLSDLELPAVVAAALVRHGIPPNRLTVEVTETTIAADPKRAMHILQELRSIGVRLSVDDFGTGYSSLAYLSLLRPDELKVDRSFVSDMKADARGGAIVRSTIELGHALGMKVTAEGVEDEATYEALRNLGCDRIQGFLVGRPVPEAQLRAWLDEASAAAASHSPVAGVAS
jgi:diguanylate cyclase (GGDEF)-like protein